MKYLTTCALVAAIVTTVLPAQALNQVLVKPVNLDPVIIKGGTSIPDLTTKLAELIHPKIMRGCNTTVSPEWLITTGLVARNHTSLPVRMWLISGFLDTGLIFKDQTDGRYKLAVINPRGELSGMDIGRLKHPVSKCSKLAHSIAEELNRGLWATPGREPNIVETFYKLQKHRL